MADFDKKINITPSEGKKRWQKILEYPDSQVFWDISDGQEYRRGQLEPLYDDRYQSVVNHFRIKGTQDEVVVNFLRLQGDKAWGCSIMRQRGQQ